MWPFSITYLFRRHVSMIHIVIDMEPPLCVWNQRSGHPKTLEVMCSLSHDAFVSSDLLSLPISIFRLRIWSDYRCHLVEVTALHLETTSFLCSYINCRRDLEEHWKNLFSLNSVSRIIWVVCLTIRSVRYFRERLCNIFHLDDYRKIIFFSHHDDKDKISIFSSRH